MSVACSTTQSRSATRERIGANFADLLRGKESAARDRAAPWLASSVMARAISSGCSPRACTIQSAMRSAERGPTPGIWRSCAIRSRIAAGYSVFLKAGQLFGLGDAFGQMQGEWLEPAQIQLQRRVFVIRCRHALFEIAGRLRPSVFRGNRTTPFQKVSRRAISSGVALFASDNKFVNFVPFAHVAPLRKSIGRATIAFCWRARKCAARAECASRKSDSRCRNGAPIPPARPSAQFRLW